MKVLVTGASGFIGRHVMRLAAARGHAVTGLTRTAEDLPRIAGVTWCEGSVANYMKATNHQFEALIHLAAHGVDPTSATWQKCFEVNVTDSLNLWLAEHVKGCRRFIICGSCFEYGLSGERYQYIPTSAPLEPTGPYHASKAAASLAAMAMSIDRSVEVFIPRPFHVFGEGEASHRFWPLLRTAALAGENFAMTTGEQVRDFIRVEKVAEKIVDGLTRSDFLPGKPVIENLGTGIPKSLADFAREQWEHFAADGELMMGQIPSRSNEVMRYVPEVILSSHSAGA